MREIRLARAGVRPPESGRRPDGDSTTEVLPKTGVAVMKWGRKERGEGAGAHETRQSPASEDGSQRHRTGAVGEDGSI